MDYFYNSNWLVKIDKVPIEASHWWPTSGGHTWCAWPSMGNMEQALHVTFVPQLLLLFYLFIYFLFYFFNLFTYFFKFFFWGGGGGGGGCEQLFNFYSNWKLLV